jgi:hypothetical protein
LDAIEVMPSLDSEPSQFQPTGARQDGQLICLGKSVCEKLANIRLFMVPWILVNLSFRLVVELSDAKC